MAQKKTIYLRPGEDPVKVLEEAARKLNNLVSASKLFADTESRSHKTNLNARISESIEWLMTYVKIEETK